MPKRLLSKIFCAISILAFICFCEANIATAKTAKTPPALHNSTGNSTSGLKLSTKDANSLKEDNKTKKLLFQIKIRPRLFAAGFGEPQEILNDDGDGDGDDYSDRGSRNLKPNTALLSDILWDFSPFPTIQNKLLEVLEQKNLPTESRLSIFKAELDFLSLCLESLQNEKTNNHYSSGSYDKKLIMSWQSTDTEYNPRQEEYSKLLPNDKKIKEEKLAFARKWLPIFFDLYTEDMPTAHLVKMQEKGLPAFLPWEDYYASSGSPVWSLHHNHYDINRFAQESLVLLWNKSADKTFQTFAQKLFASRAGPNDLRLKVLTMTAEYPGKTQNEYFAASVYEDSSNSVNSCWEWKKETFAYGLTFGCSDGKSFKNYIQRLENSPRIITKDEKGTGIALDPLPEPVFNSASPKYLLIYSKVILPKNLRPLVDSALNAFAGTPMEYMDKGPRIIPLDPKNKNSEALMRWFIEKGGPKGHAMLFASHKNSKEITAQTVRMHLTMWEQQPDKPDFVCSLPYNGSFFNALLPELHGKAAAHFMGAFDNIWFFLPDLDGGKWYKASPQKPLPHLTPTEQNSILMLSTPTYEALNKKYGEDWMLWRTNMLISKYPKPNITLKQAYSFLNEANNKAYNFWHDKNSDDGGQYKRDEALKLIWQVHDTPIEKEATEIIFAPLSVKDDDIYRRGDKIKELLKNLANSTKAQESSPQDSQEND